jgi:hypothetical protein
VQHSTLITRYDTWLSGHVVATWRITHFFVVTIPYYGMWSYLCSKEIANENKNVLIICINFSILCAWFVKQS